jgi:hypothetical protein
MRRPPGARAIAPLTLAACLAVGCAAAARAADDRPGCPTSPCLAATVVTTATALRDALGSWHPEDEPVGLFRVIEIPEGTDIDLDPIASDLPLEVRARVVLQGTRGERRPGALLHLDDFPFDEEGEAITRLFNVTGSAVQIRNLRLRGPSGATAESGTACRQAWLVLCPGVTAINAPDRYAATIANNELFEWHGIAVRVAADDPDSETCGAPSSTRSARVRVVGNYIHDNQRTGLGYGVQAGHGAFVFIDGNTFDWNRHAVASDGQPRSGYHAQYNYVLSGGSRYGGTPPFYKGSYEQHFDMHGTGEDGRGGVAGDLVVILGNTVHGEQDYGLDKTRPAYWLRGRPCGLHSFRDNVVVHEQDEAVRETNGGEGRVYRLNNRYDTDTSWSIAVGDFDRDGRDDLFQATGAAWYYSSGGQTEWRLLQRARRETIDRLRFGDFDGDGDTDVFTASGGEWRIARGGTEPWTHLNRSDVPLEELRFADFDGDGRTDVFRATGTRWYFSRSGTGLWQPLADSSVRVGDLRLGNFDGDTRTDVFSLARGQWSVSLDGLSTWQRLNSELSDDLDSLVFADFDGNGRTDIAQSGGTQLVVWRVSRDGAGGWEPLRTFPSLQGDRYAQLYNHWIGRFDRFRGADALRYSGVDIVRSSGASAGYVRHSWNGMR